MTSPGSSSANRAASKASAYRGYFSRSGSETLTRLIGAPAGVAVAPQSGPVSTGGFDLKTEDMALPGAKTLSSIYQVLETQPVAPNQGWGGYYVFNLPKGVRAQKASVPLTITVTTGSEVRRFNATLQYR